VAALLTCETDPLTGKKTLALVSDKELFTASFTQYTDFLNENIVIDDTFTVKNLNIRLDEAKKQNYPDDKTKEATIKKLQDAIAIASSKEKLAEVKKHAEMVNRLGDKISAAAQKWYVKIGKSKYLNDYQWEYHLVMDDQVNAWCLPGGKIVVYTGILPVTQNEDALATVMGHEVAHALLNHGRQRVSVAFLENLGLAAAGLAASLSGASEQTQSLFLAALGVGSTLAVALPFSRENESEADEYGLYLMAIAGYDPEASVPFWGRMAAGSGGTLEFLSTHPDPEKRMEALQKLIPKAKAKAIEINGN